MKNFHNHLFAFTLTVICILSTANTFAQVPQSMNYQAVARNATGVIIPNQAVGLRFSVRDGSAGGTIVYRETNSDTTNEFGLFTASVGTGTVISGTFSGIIWGSGNKYLQVEIDMAGGTNYTNMGTTQLLSVPYALHAQTSGSSYNAYQFKNTSIPTNTVRNAIVLTADSLVVAETGTYLLSFYVIGTDNDNGLSTATNYDYSAVAGVFDLNLGSSVTASLPFAQVVTDQYADGSTVYKFIPMNASATSVNYFTAGTVLKGAAYIGAAGTPTSNWAIGTFYFSIVKLQ